MCGIVGFTGNRQAAPILLDGLAKLEYRGYDSAGLAVRDGEKLAEVVKSKGRLSNLIEKTDSGDWRTKDNKSKVYVKVNYVKNNKNKVTGYVEGKKYAESPAQNCSGGYYYSLNKKGEQWMTNYVHNEKLGYARIKGKVPAQAPNVIEGVWSPDSGQ